MVFGNEETFAVINCAEWCIGSITVTRRDGETDRQMWNRAKEEAAREWGPMLGLRSSHDTSKGR